MIIEKRLFPAQGKDEKILLILRRHWFTYAIFWFITILLLVPLIVFFAYTINNHNAITESIQSISILACSIYILFIFALLVNGFVDYYLDVYIITDRRIVDIAQDGLFKREISELNLRQIQDVSAHVDGVFPTLFHYGNINVQTAAERPNFSFVKIPHPYEVSKKILDLHEAYLKRGRPQGKSIKSIILDDFQESECYSKETCDKKLLEDINKTKKEQKNVIKNTKARAIISTSAKIGPRKKPKIKKINSKNKGVRTNTIIKKNTVREVNIDGISLVKTTNDQQQKEEGKLEEGEEVDLK
jgi:hypothetical protein